MNNLKLISLILLALKEILDLIDQLDLAAINSESSLVREMEPKG